MPNKLLFGYEELGLVGTDGGDESWGVGLVWLG